MSLKNKEVQLLGLLLGQSPGVTPLCVRITVFNHRVQTNTAMGKTQEQNLSSWIWSLIASVRVAI